MIRKHSELKIDQLTDFRGGKGPLIMEHFMDQAMAMGAGRLFVRSVVPPGSSIGLHKHEGDSELYYILSGKALANDNGTLVEIGPGDTQFCPDGSSHGIENIGTEDLIYIAIILFTEQKKP